MLTVTNWLKINQLKKIKGIGLLLLPILFYFIPVSKLNGQHTICLFKNITGYECYGCGMTRAVLSVLHFDFHTAFCYNRLVVFVFPLLVYVWAKTIYQCFLK